MLSVNQKEFDMKRLIISIIFAMFACISAQAYYNPAPYYRGYNTYYASNRGYAYNPPTYQRRAVAYQPRTYYQAPYAREYTPYENNPAFYISLKGGFGGLKDRHADEDDEILTGLSGMAALGLRVKTPVINLRTELEFGYAEFKYKSKENLWFGPDDLLTIYGTLTAKPFTVLGNLYLDFLEDYRLKPYIGIGLGMTRIGLSSKADFGYSGQIIPTYKVDFGPYTEFTYGLHLGFGFGITDNLSGDVGLRSFFGRISDQGDFIRADITFGLRYTF
jgi:opacity protein-like surface antigen